MNIHIEEIKQKVLPILQRYGIKRAGLFGSCVRGEMNDDSDIDILVEIERDISLLDFAGIKIKIEEALGKRVDLVEYNAVKPLLKEKVLREEVKIQ